MAGDALWAVEYGWFVLTDEDDNVTGRVDLDGLRPEQSQPGRLIEPDATFPGLSYPVPDLIGNVRGQLADRLAPKVDALRAVLASIRRA